MRASPLRGTSRTKSTPHSPERACSGVCSFVLTCPQLQAEQGLRLRLKPTLAFGPERLVEGHAIPAPCPAPAQASKPFARYEQDQEHDAQLRERARFGDPFANLARRPAAAAEHAGRSEGLGKALTERYDAEKLEKSGGWLG